jgi:uncharacterized protein with LGFP repeats
MRRMVTGSLALSVGLTSVVLVAPVLSNPLAAKAHPVEARTTELRLGDVDAPGAGVTRRAGLLQGITLAPDAAAKATAKAAAKSITLRRESTSEFSAVGVTWALDPAVTGVSVAVRAKATDGTWGAWRAADNEENPSGRTGDGIRGGAGMIWTGPATGVDIAVTSVAGKAPEDVRLELIDPGTSPADANPEAAAPAAAAHAALAMPKIYSRASWGADERKMSWAPSYAPAVKAITLHHTVNSNNYTAAQVPAMLRSIYQFHAVSNGWGDVGYNVIVDRFGRLWEGRTGGLSRAVGGAHAGGFNYSTAGISMLGDFSKAGVPPAMREAIARYAAWKLAMYGVDPTSSTTLRGGQNSKFKNIVNLEVDTIFPHRTTSLTACPGSGGMAALPWIRSRAKQLMGNWAKPTHTAAYLSTFDRKTGTWFFRNGTKRVWGAAGDIAQPGDFTGDALPDTMVYRPSTGQWLLRGGKTVKWGSPNRDLPVPGYYGKLNRLDYAVWRRVTGEWWIQGSNPVKFGAAADKPVPADYNGDGRTDLAVYTPATGKWSVRGLGSFTFGKSGDIPVPGDYNGDGKVEAAVFRPSSGTWMVRGGATVVFGQQRGDVPLPGLYDNDLRADIAIYRASTATFHVYRGQTVKLGAPSHTPLVYR